MLLDDLMRYEREAQKALASIGMRGMMDMKPPTPPELPEPAGHVINMGGYDGWSISDYAVSNELDEGSHVFTPSQLRERDAYWMARIREAVKEAYELGYSAGSWLPAERSAAIRSQES